MAKAQLYYFWHYHVATRIGMLYVESIQTSTSPGGSEL
jgi:hypothetical protein